MPSKPRPYRPKVRGCYECSQRRISCDRTDPECQKCVSKGLKCSGLNVRYRFAPGAAVRGKWAGIPIQCVFDPERQEDEDNQASTATIGKSQDPGRFPSTVSKVYRKRQGGPSKGFSVLDFRSGKGTARKAQERIEPLDTGEPISTHIGVESNADNESETTEDDEAANAFWQSITGDEFVDEEVFQSHQTVLDEELALEQNSAYLHSMGAKELSGFINPAQVMVWEPLPDNAPAWKRNLFFHYSDKIAVEMMAIDGRHNGWRHFVLPMAHADDLVMNAVLTVSAFHVTCSKADPKDHLTKPKAILLPSAGTTTSAEALYEQTIQGLKSRCTLNTDEARLSVVLTILLLLIVVMVTGSEDFPLLFGMLQSALDAIGGEEHLGGSDMGDFIIRQIRKMRAYAAPHISEQTGLSILASEIRWNQCFDCLRWCSQTQPEHSDQLSAVINLVQQAHDIYLNQALSPAHDSSTSSTELAESIARLERFRTSLEAFPKNSTGEQVLIWATFLAASDCVLDEHKTFFEETLMRHHHRSGFGNLLRGLKHLRNIWAKRSEGDVRWTRLLPQARMFLM